jgi:hypothetical protein
MTEFPLMTRAQAVEFLRAELGIPVSLSKFNKLAMPSMGEGPPVAKWWDSRPLYAREAVQAWAEARCRPLPSQAFPGPRD